MNQRLTANAHGSLPAKIRAAGKLLARPQDAWVQLCQAARNITGREIIEDKSHPQLNGKLVAQWYAQAMAVDPAVFAPVREHQQYVIENMDEQVVHTPNQGADRELTQGQCCELVSLPVSDGRMLYQLIRSHGFTRTVEMGGAFGVGTRYQACALRDNAKDHPPQDGEQPAVWSIELHHWRRDIATQKLGELEPYVRAEAGRIEEVFPVIAPQRPGIQFAFIDALHTYDATVGYLELIKQHVAGQCFCVFHDVNNNLEMLRTWKAIASDSAVLGAVHRQRLGFCLVQGQAEETQTA